MTEPETLPGPLKDILERLSKLERDYQVLQAHVLTDAQAYERIGPEITNLLDRLAVVESKTFGLASQPGRRICPSCHRQVTNPRASTCGLCGATLPPQ